MAFFAPYLILIETECIKGIPDLHDLPILSILKSPGNNQNENLQKLLLVKQFKKYYCDFNLNRIL